MANTRINSTGEAIGDPNGDLDYVSTRVGRRAISPKVFRTIGPATTNRSHPSRPYIGPVPGESEGEIIPAGHESFPEPLSDKELALGQAGIAAAREALERTKN